MTTLARPQRPSYAEAAADAAIDALRCYWCQYVFDAAELVDLDGVQHCLECAYRATGDDGRPDRVRGL